LREDAPHVRFDCGLFRALDRFTPEEMVPTSMHMQRLARYGVGFRSCTGPHLATDHELVQDILLAVLGSLAKQERSERTKDHCTLSYGGSTLIFQTND
jgi:hypothetical protein